MHRYNLFVFCMLLVLYLMLVQGYPQLAQGLNTPIIYRKATIMQALVSVAPFALSGFKPMDTDKVMRCLVLYYLVHGLRRLHELTGKQLDTLEIASKQ
jgi:hypothetical protein